MPKIVKEYEIYMGYIKPSQGIPKIVNVYQDTQGIPMIVKEGQVLHPSPIFRPYHCSIIICFLTILLCVTQVDDEYKDDVVRCSLRATHQPSA